MLLGPSSRAVGGLAPPPTTPSARNPILAREAGGGTGDPQPDRQTGDTVELPSGMSGHVSSHHPAACSAEEPSREPRPGGLGPPPRRQPANGCNHPKLRAGWAGGVSHQKAPGKEEASRSLDLRVGPNRPSLPPEQLGPHRPCLHGVLFS